MVKLKNIERNKKIITCDLFPEDSLLPGKLSVNIDSSTADYSLPSGYDWCQIHVRHAVRKILELASMDQLPKETTVMWV